MTGQLSQTDEQALKYSQASIMETATFYVGDLCHVLTDSEWDAVCAGDLDGEDHLDPEDYDPRDQESGRPYSIFRTEHGDGWYSDSEGKRYGVDSGTIGCIKAEYISDITLLQAALNKGLGHLHELDTYAVGDAACDGGIMYFDTVCIETA